MRRLTIAAALASAALGVACSSGTTRTTTSTAPAEAPPPFYRPVVGLRSVRFVGAGITGGTMDLVLNVYNPNEYRLLSPRISYRVMVDETELGRGIYDADATILPADSVSLRVPVEVDYSSIGRGARAMLGNGSVTYRVLGHIYVDTPYGRLAAPYDRVGRFSPMTAALPQGSR
jgi:hypothetical protein